MSSSTDDLKMSEFDLAGPISLITDFVPIVRVVAGVPENLLGAVADLPAGEGGGGGGGGVFSVFGRVGTVLAQAGDYNWTQISGSTLPVVSGQNVTNLNASQLVSGTLPGTIFPATLPASSGVNLTSLNASQLLTGTIPGARLPAVLPAIDGSALLNLNASQLTAGTIPGARFPAVLPAASGVNLTNLNASQLTSGTLPNATFPAILPAVSGQNLTNLPPPVFAAPSALVGLTALPGTGTAAMRADAAPALNQGITPTWTANHTFSVSVTTPKLVGTPGLECTGDLFISNTPVAKLMLLDQNTGWTSAATTVINPLATNQIRSSNYSSGIIGWNISAAGNAEFNNIDVRGALHASIFVYNALAATAGTLGVFKSAVKLRADFTLPSAPVYGTTTVTFDAVDPEGISHAAGNLLAIGDLVRLKDGPVGDTYLKITAQADLGSFWRYTATIMAGAANVVYRAGLGVADYGASGQGFLLLTADSPNSPYLQMATQTGIDTPSAGGNLVVQPRLRVGNLNGSYGYSANTYGFATGQYGTSGQSWVTVDETAGVRIGNNLTTRIQLAPDGSGFLATNLISWTTAGVTTIAGWTINATSISSGTTYLASGLNLPTGSVAWFGKSNAGYQGWALIDSAGRGIQAIVNNGGLYPYLTFKDTVRYRIVLGGLNNAWGTDGATDSIGLKIWDSGGTKLLEFSDVQNMISGWTITQNYLARGTTYLAANFDPPSNDYTWFGKGAGGFSGWAISDASGRGLQALVNNGGRYPYLGVNDGTRWRVVLGGLNDSWGTDGPTDSMGLKIFDSAGACLSEFSSVRNVISGWTIGTTSIASTGVVLNSGANAGLAFGTTPPTGAGAGTGIWLDRTGLYGLNGGVVQAKIDANGRLTAGAGNVTLDVNGLTIAGGSAAPNLINWMDSGNMIAQMYAARFGSGATAQAAMAIAATGYSRESSGFADLELSVMHAGATGQNPRFAIVKWGSGSTHANQAAFTFEVGSGGVTIGTLIDAYAPPPASVALHLNTTVGAFLPPRLTSTQRDALTGLDGMVIFNTTTTKLQTRAGGVWVDLH